MKIATLQPRLPMLHGSTQTLSTPGWQDARHGSRHARGYGTAWDKLRLVILERDGHLCQCQDCKAAGRVKPAHAVDHIISKAEWRITHGSLEGVDHPSNLQAINRECHTRKTAEDSRRAYGRGGA